MQIQVHIIEARELKAENLDGTSDPVVYVECFGQKQNTIVVKSVCMYIVVVYSADASVTLEFVCIYCVVIVEVSLYIFTYSFSF